MNKEIREFTMAYDMATVVLAFLLLVGTSLMA
jgi:hypothetical protein